MENKDLTKQKKTIKKKTIIIHTLLTVGVVAIGATLGTLLGKFVFVSTVDYSSLNSNEMIDDQVALMKRYDDIKDTATINDYLNKFETYELMNIGFNKIAFHDYHYLVGTGVVDAMGVKQTIRSYAIKDKDKEFSESLSKSSIVQVAKRFYQEDGHVDIYKGKLTSVDKAIWDKDSKKTQSIEEYSADWGRDLTIPTVYVISSKTTLETSTKEEKNNRIILELDLHKTKSVVNYVKQMAMTSDLTDYPVFESVHFQAILDDKLNIIETTATESYKVKKGVWAPATGTLRELHFYDDYLAIPDLDTDCIYE